ncbi:hypothetical protein PVIIG_06182 [Plasmodium vivax India VII]|uniref:Variable surface protein Vir35 n=1 Tax=Plasmodium vivax India VII TaxID=1077284 RepID=A0A0J9S313_PLAVI|nr:hypothetical protein PVIIG_06182 [Plasmodium vivax India VII]
MRGNVRMNTLFKVSAYIIFIWIYNSYNLYNHGTNLEKLYNVERNSNITFQRSLAKYVPKTDLDRSKTRAKFSENNSYSNVKSTSDDLTKCAQLKKKGLNDLDLYQKLYKHRYSKRNVLGKLECYCEKSIFDKIGYIENLAEKMQNNKKSFIKKVLGKYGVGILLFSLFPITGILFPILFGSIDKNDKTAIISFCTHSDSEQSTNDCSSTMITRETAKLLEGIIPTIKNIFYYVLPTIVILFTIYTFVKVLKYERLRSGKDKMSIKEYCSLCKDIF